MQPPNGFFSIESIKTFFWDYSVMQKINNFTVE